MSLTLRNNFSDFFFETALPSINEVLKDEFAQKPKLMSELFLIKSSDRSIEQGTGISGLGYAAEIVEGGEVTTDMPVQEFDSLFKHKKYGLGIEWGKETFDDEKFGLIETTTRELANSIAESVEIQAFEVFNNAFSAGAYAGPDGVALCSASHPLVKGGGTQSNILSSPADISVTSLKTALTDWMSMRRSNRHHISLPTPRVLIPVNSHFDVHEILKGVYRSDTANNTINAFKYGEHGPIEKIITAVKLVDTDAWFLVAPPRSTGLRWYWRMKPYQKPFADERTERAGIAMRYRMSRGWVHPWGVYGTPGV